MSDITNNRTDSVSIQERVRIAEAAKAKLDAEIAENNRLLEELRKAEEALLNDPVERAKSLADANKMIENGIKEYEAKGYKVNIVFDENNLFEKLIFKFGTSRKTGTRGPRKSAGQEGFIPAMTRDQFVEIYPSLGKDFKNQDIVAALVKKFGAGKYTNFRTQPSLGLIFADGYNGIKIEKVGTQGRNVYYQKIS